MTRLTNTLPIFLDARGSPADGAFIYVGVAFSDPQQTPINVFWDEAQTQPATQPLRTLGGVIVNGATPSNVFFAATDFSMLVQDVDGNQVSYTPSTYTDTGQYQPKSDNLTYIATHQALPFGAGLLGLANQDALARATGFPFPLAAAGGTVSGDIKRQAAGVYTYWADPAMTSGRVFLTQAGASDPTSQPGDIWFQWS